MQTVQFILNWTVWTITKLITNLNWTVQFKINWIVFARTFSLALNKL